MDYGSTAELEYTIGREFSRRSLKINEIMRKRLSESSLANVDLRFVYCPILMPEQHRYRSESRYSKKKKELICNPQLDYDKYITGDAKTRRQVYLTGLLSAVPLMKRAGLSNEEIQEFTDVVESLIAEGCD